MFSSVRVGLNYNYIDLQKQFSFFHFILFLVFYLILK